MSARCKSITVLGKTVDSAFYNVSCQAVFKIITFLLNIFILRFISKETIGLVNVRLMLLYTTALFLSRECFRQACLSESQPKSWRKLVNLLWLTLPLGIIIHVLLACIWLFVFELPSDVSTYRLSVGCFALASFCELACEPLLVLSKLRYELNLVMRAEGLANLVKCCLTVLLLWIVPQWGIFIFCITQFAYACTVSLVVYLRFPSLFKNNNYSNKADFPFTSLSQLLPTDIMKSGIDKDAAFLVFSFFRQSLMKHILTEGERFIMTSFMLLSFAGQGVYEVVNNLGSLVARILFQPLEHSAYIFFTNTLQRGLLPYQQERKAFAEAVQFLCNLLRFVSLVGFTFVSFGAAYSQLFLEVYGGHRFANDNDGPLLLKWYCCYILLLAWNGITECFMSAVMTKGQVDKYTLKMMFFSFIFLIATFFLVHHFGAVGFILANCLNMLLRIAHSCYFINCMYNHDTVLALSSHSSNSKYENGDYNLSHQQTIVSTASPKVKVMFWRRYPVMTAMIPDSFVCLAFLVSLVITLQSERQLCTSVSSLVAKLSHIVIGAICLLTVLTVTYFRERSLVAFFKQFLFKNKSNVE